MTGDAAIGRRGRRVALDRDDQPPGAPGGPARWTSSAKSGVGTALSGTSRVWFTLSHGILNEIYFPRIDTACVRDLGLIVTGPDGYFAEEKRDARSETRMIEAGVPAFQMVNTALDGRWRIEKTVLANPRGPVLLQEIVFTLHEGEPADHRLFALLAPHLVNAGADNTGWVDDYKGTPMLFASDTPSVPRANSIGVPL